MALFSRQKKEKRKGQETTIGKIIYSFLLFMPILAVGVACLYVVLNKNAYESYSDKYVENIQNVTNQNMLISDNDYMFNPKKFYNYNETYVNAGKIKYNTINVNWNDILSTSQQLTPQELQNVNGFVFYHGSTTDIRLNLYQDDTLIRQAVQSINNPGTILRNLDQTIYFNFNSSMNWSIGSYQLSFNSESLKTIILMKDTLDNVFYYQLEKLEESNLFNWTKDTGTYTVIHNTTTGLGITNTYMPMLLTYWLIVSVIYFIYDIGLMLVWVMHRKIHELQEEI